MKSNIARNADNVLAAEQLFNLFKEYQIAGFTEEQAFQMILQAIDSTIIAQSMHYHMGEKK